jgi:hypothetical protein
VTSGDRPDCNEGGMRPGDALISTNVLRCLTARFPGGFDCCFRDRLGFEIIWARGVSKGVRCRSATFGLCE